METRGTYDFAWVPASSLPAKWSDIGFQPTDYLPLIINESTGAYRFFPFCLAASFLIGYLNDPPPSVDHRLFKSQCRSAIGKVARIVGVEPQKLSADSAGPARRSYGFSLSYRILDGAHTIFPPDTRIAHDLLLDAWNVLCFDPPPDPGPILASIVSATSEEVLRESDPRNIPIFAYSLVYAFVLMGRENEAREQIEQLERSGMVTAGQRSQLDGRVSRPAAMGNELSASFAEFMNG